MRFESLLAVVVTVAMLSAAGALPQPRTAQNAGFGVAVGTAGALALGAPIVAGVVVGGAAGAFYGAVTPPGGISRTLAFN